MQRVINNNPFLSSLLTALLSCLLWTSAQAAEPLWTMVPAPGSNPSQTVPENGTATVQYVVQNQSGKVKRLVIQPLPGITQTTPCQLAPRGQAGSSCILNLAINGSALPTGGVHGGPNLCQANPDGSPNPNQCYRPNSANILDITHGPATGATITVNPSVLNFVAGNNGLVTVTNSVTSPEPANNVVATIPGVSNISVQSTTCGPSLAIGASCTIIFTATAAEGPTNIDISGGNTNTENVAVSVTPEPIAILSVNPGTLLFAENSTGIVAVTNNVASPVSADNVAATIPGGSNISVQSTTCGAVLAIGASCTITFASATQEGPTTISIAGDNTNTVNVDVTVTSQPQISITSPVQQSRVVTVSEVTPLSLEITNNVGSAVNANAITVSNKAACPNLSVDASNCTTVAPGASCTLALTSTTPYTSCTITVSGSNTANSPQTLIAFFYLQGLVFEGSGGNGKVVSDLALGFSSEWTNTITNISGATSLTDGVANTDAIVVDVACTGSPANCAAQRCRNIGPEWYLPVRNELSAIRLALCSNSTLPCNFGGFSSSTYWASTQSGANFADLLIFPSGGGINGNKGAVRSVRCVRTFSI